MNISKKRIGVNVLIILILEVMFIIAAKDTGGIFTLLAGLISIPMIVLSVNFMSNSIENTLILTTFMIPLLPICGYVMNRMGIEDWQWLVYTMFYIIIALCLIKNRIHEKFELNGIKIKDKIIKVSLFILLIINIFFAYNKQLSFMIISLSFIPFTAFMLIIMGVKVEDKKKLYNSILVAFMIGAILSSIPDNISYIMFWIRGQRTVRLFGPLGSNYILIYDLVLFVIAIGQWVKVKRIKSYWTVIVVAFAYIIGMQLSRGAYICFVAISIAFILFNISNWKRYLPLFLIFGTLMTYNVTSRPDVANDDGILAIQELITGNNVNEFEMDGAFGKVVMGILKTQSKTRQILWKTGIMITEDHKLTGVGIGNFKYYFNEYSGSRKDYSDAHNILLNMSSELGIPFMILGFTLNIIIGIGALINYFKTKDKDKKINYLTLMIIAGVFLIYGNFTGIAFQTTKLIYSFTPTFLILFILMYRDCIENF